MKTFIEKCARIFAGVPLYKALPSSVLRGLYAGVRMAWLKCSALEYASLCVFSSIFVSLFSLLIFSPLSIEAQIFSSLLLSALFFAGALRYPAFLASERAAELERDLATGLKTVSLGLAGGSSFESSLSRASRGHGVFSQEASRILREVRGGTSVPNAVSSLASHDSLLVKRAASQLAFEYEHGGDGRGLSAIADEALARQAVLAREHAGRLSFLTVVFVAVSAVVPALFSAYLVVASSFLEIPFSEAEILAVFALVLPLLDCLVILAVFYRAPKLSVSR